MVLQGPDFWDVAGDCLQIILCLFALFFFIRIWLNQKRSVSKETVKNVGKSFNEQVFTQTVQQQIDQAFTNIMESLTVERKNLESVLGLNHVSSEDVGMAKKQSISQMPNSLVNSRVSDETVGDSRQNEKIHKYAAKGLSARKISDELRIPISEVELILSLEKK